MQKVKSPGNGAFLYLSDETDSKSISINFDL